MNIDLHDNNVMVLGTDPKSNDRFALSIKIYWMFYANTPLFN